MTNDRTALLASAAHDGALMGVRAGSLLIENDAKGYSPVRTGNNRRSIHSDVVDGGSVISAKIGPSTDYGIYLEFGTRRMAPRPFMRPAFEGNRDNVTAAIKSNVQSAIIAALGGGR